MRRVLPLLGLLEASLLPDLALNSVQSRPRIFQRVHRVEAVEQLQLGIEIDDAHVASPLWGSFAKSVRTSRPSRSVSRSEPVGYVAENIYATCPIGNIPIETCPRMRNSKYRR